MTPGGEALPAEIQLALLDAVPAEVAVLDAAGKITYVNAAWRRFGEANGLRSRNHCVGMDYLEACGEAPEAGGTVAAAIRDLLAGRSDSASFEYACHSETEQRWFLMRAVAMSAQLGRAVFVMHVDISERYRAAQELTRVSLETQRRERMLGNMLGAITDLTYATDAQGRLLYANPGTLQLWGTTLEQALGKTVLELGYPAEAANKLQRQIAQVFATGLPVRDEMPFTCAQGGKYYFEYIFSPGFAPDGSVEIMVGASRDTTDRKRAERELLELNEQLEARVRERTAELALARIEADRANAAKSAFLAAMSHEIRTPMSGMLGLLELMELTPLDEEQRSTLKVARRSGDALKQIIDGILDFSRIEAGSLELDLAPCCIADLVDNVSRLHSSIAASKSIVLSTSVDPGISHSLMCDALRVGQILNNLAGNALKFTERGRVDIAVTVVGRQNGREHLQFTVTDTGIGIPPDRIGRLFRPFSQADSKVAAHFGGSGLGLFIARSLAALMGGTVSLESKVGVGTTVTLQLALGICPLGSAPEAVHDSQRTRLNQLVAERPASPTITEAQAQGSLMLVVDDHPINRMVLVRQLSKLGYAAEAAADGLQALRAWESGRFAGIITDCNMPRMDGFELTRRIREREAAGAHIPIIGCTANAQASSATACTAAGMDAAVIKPVALEVLCEVLDRWVPLPSIRRRHGSSPALPGIATAAAANAANGLLDLALLAAISEGDPAAGLQIIADFRRNNEDDARNLRRAAANDDRAEIVRSAHRLRGAAAMLGAKFLAQACADLQKSASAGEAAIIEADLDTFEMEFLRLKNFLDQLDSQPHHWPVAYPGRYSMRGSEPASMSEPS